MTDALWGCIALSGDIAKPYDRPPPEESAVAFSLTREGIQTLRLLLDALERSMDGVGRARVSPSPEATT